MIIGYARVSTADQNIDLQVEALKAAGCDKIFEEHGVSAVADERPLFKELIKVLKPDDTLVIWKMDRAFRSVADAISVFQKLRDRDVRFKSLTDFPIDDWDSPYGQLIYQITNAFAEFERSLLVERTKEGMKSAKRRGARIGRPPSLNRFQVELAEKARKQGATFESLSKILNVHPRTVSRALGRTKLTA